MKERNRVNGFVLTVLGLLAFSLSCMASPSDGKVTLNDLLNRKTIRVRDVMRLNLDVKVADGPALYAVVDTKTVVWFWCKPGIRSSLGVGKILLVATAAPNDENNGTIIWPKSKIGHDYGEELKAIDN